jgi:DNA-binding FadR family transcriptional regulator
VEADRRFHLRVAEMAGNAVMADIAGTLFDRRHRVVGERLDGRVEPALAWQAALAEHEAIYRALEERNPQAAALAMGSHLQASLVRWEA